MTWGLRGGLAAAAGLLAMAASVRAQDWEVSVGYKKAVRRGDHMEWLLANGVHITNGQLEIRAERGLVLLDRDEIVLPGRTGEGLSRRGLVPPATRRRISDAVLRERLSSLLRTVQGEAARPLRRSAFPLGLLKTLYLEGDVAVLRDGREIGRAQRLHFSAIDDRTIMHEAELRLWSANRANAQRVLIIRGDRLVRQGSRTTGRDVSLTPCSAGKPHFEVKLGEIEIIEREADFEVRTRAGTLAFSGVGVLPLPNTRFFTNDQTNFPIQGASGGYSSSEGARTGVDIGGSFNTIGGALHEYFTGQPGHEFRGDWHLGLGFNQERGVPLEAGLVYAAEDQYRGHLDTFYLDDGGSNRRDIRNNLDGTLIDENNRSLVRTENRIHLGDRTRVDLTLFHASDAAVLSEFYPRAYREEEIPESNVYLRHGDENRLFTASARFNLADFSYADDRSLAPAFTEELPLATFHWFSEPIVTLPGDIPLLLTSASSAGYLRSDFDKTVASIDDETVRLDQELELSAPFWLGPVGISPFASARVTYYDETVAGGDRTRWAFATGLRAGTRLARSWSWIDSEGHRQALRHVMSPTVTVAHRFRVDGDPADFRQFDETDSITEGAEVRFELLNRLQRRGQGTGPQDFLWLDLAQTLTPISDRDNNGHHLGLFEYELIVRPAPEWLPIPNLRMVLEGEHDWNAGEARTLNAGASFGKVLGLNWRAGYRTDRNTDGAIIYGIDTDVLGRWSLSGNSQYDLELSETLNYVVGIIRHDHDWRIHLGIVFDRVADDTRVFVNFEPTVGGLFKVRDRYHADRNWYAY